VRIVRPFVREEVAADLRKRRPRLDGSRVLHLANREPKNGTELLLSAWRLVAAQRPEARLRLIGADSVAFGGRAAGLPGVEIGGRVPSVGPELERADLFVMPGLGQACPVASLEAMLAGTPALVSTETGTLDLVAEADPLLVVEPSEKAIADGILRYLASDSTSRARTAGLLRQAAAPLTEESQRTAFREALSFLTGRELRGTTRGGEPTQRTAEGAASGDGDRLARA
jgi:glycosyltransferase involved in cell wall biosynthesis